MDAVPYSDPHIHRQYKITILIQIRLRPSGSDVCKAAVQRLEDHLALPRSQLQRLDQCSRPFMRSYVHAHRNTTD
jgi:hypothetical protein